MNHNTPCERFVEEISGSQPASKELTEHLAVCPACRAMAETAAKLRSETSAYSQAETAALTGRVLSRLAKASSEFPKGPVAPEILNSQTAATGINKLVLVGAAALGIIGGLWWFASLSEQPETSGGDRPPAILQQDDRPVSETSAVSQPIPLLTGGERGEVASKTVPGLDGE